MAGISTLPAPKAPRARRTLGPTGRKCWRALWAAGANWLDSDLDHELALLWCEGMDERQELRERLAETDPGEDWRDRIALRSLEVALERRLLELGMSPKQRKALSVATESKGKLAELRKRRRA